jgi:hypothetical protein
MAVQASFEPNYTRGITVAPGTASASSVIGFGSKALVFTNLSPTVISYIRVGNAGITASTADYPLLPNSQISVSKCQDDTHVAYITSSGTGSIHIIPGEGY